MAAVTDSGPVAALESLGDAGTALMKIQKTLGGLGNRRANVQSSADAAAAAATAAAATAATAAVACNLNRSWHS